MTDNIVHVDPKVIRKPILTIRGVRTDDLLADMIDLQNSLSRVIAHLRTVCGDEEE